MIDDGVFGFVELLAEQFFAQRHADRVGNALTERAGGGFNARSDTVFGMAGGFAVQLTEVFDLFHRQIVAGQMQQ